MFKIYTRWVLLNFSFTFLFVYSHIVQNERLIAVAVFFGWTVSVLAWALLSKSALHNRVKTYAKGEKFADKDLDLTFDFILTGVIVYYGYLWLGGFYFFHSIILHEFKKAVEEKANEII